MWLVYLEMFVSVCSYFVLHCDLYKKSRVDQSAVQLRQIETANYRILFLKVKGIKKKTKHFVNFLQMNKITILFILCEKINKNKVH